MTIQSWTTRSLGRGGMRGARSRSGAIARTACLGLACLIVAVSLAGCWDDTATTDQIARELHTATLLRDGRVLVAGGRYLAGKTSWLSVASAELYDPATGTFSSTGPMVTAREDHTATLLTDGRVLIAGGDNGVLDPTSAWHLALPSAELYDPKTGTFSPTGPMTKSS